MHKEKIVIGLILKTTMKEIFIYKTKNGTPKIES